MPRASEVGKESNRRSRIAVTVLRGDRRIITGIEQEWTHLCLENPESTPFYTPEWHRVWLESFEPSSCLVLLVARRDGALRGVLPLLEERRGRRTLQFVRLRAPSNFYTGRADLICGRDDADEVALAIWQVLSRSMRWDVLEYRDAPAAGGFTKIAAAAESAGYPQITRSTLISPFIPIRVGEDVSRLGPRKHISRAKRNLEKQGGYTYAMVPAAQEPGSIQRFLDQEASGWKGEAGTAIRCDPAADAFYRTLWATQPASFSPVAHELRTEAGAIAIDIGFEMNGCYFGTKGSYDENWKNVGPGHLNLHEMIVGLSSRGFTEIDLLGHNDSYKLLWTKDVRHLVHYIVFRKNVRGRASAWLGKTLLPLTAKWQGSTALTASIGLFGNRCTQKLRVLSTRITNPVLVLVPGGEMVRGIVTDIVLLF